MFEPSPAFCFCISCLQVTLKWKDSYTTFLIECLVLLCCFKEDLFIVQRRYSKYGKPNFKAFKENITDNTLRIVTSESWRSLSYCLNTN